MVYKSTAALNFFPIVFLTPTSSSAIRRVIWTKFRAARASNISNICVSVTGCCPAFRAFQVSHTLSTRGQHIRLSFLSVGDTLIYEKNPHAMRIVMVYKSTGYGENRKSRQWQISVSVYNST